MDAAHAAQSYGFIKIIIWAIPILGFLGTVIGITIAIASLQPEAAWSSRCPKLPAAWAWRSTPRRWRSGLSMVLMFVQFVVDKFENRLLAAVDRRMTEELVGRFQASSLPRKTR